MEKYKYPWWDRPLSYGILFCLLGFVIGMTVKPNGSISYIFYTFSMVGGIFGVIAGFFLNMFLKASNATIIEQSPGLVEQIKHLIFNKERRIFYRILLPILLGPIMVGIVLSAIFKKASSKTIIIFSVFIGITSYLVWLDIYRKDENLAIIGAFAVSLIPLLVLEYKIKKGQTTITNKDL